MAAPGTATHVAEVARQLAAARETATWALIGQAAAAAAAAAPPAAQPGKS